ncbi:helix-turn-helix domain-containing protein [Iningainema tapete]|uniref:Helix-turn-helix transcriptional regulator n=1 Tax=Iningainema tapete BLCC-T55 TaxID=2748662 RepID=A0A8J6XC83_9CYAN|nr:helix-turn-helix transcriptional regulator [Iningainema tapete]MBD2772254.1 helix-turn-helix transcriptional regulator [Iningainema tapete BLCC-T55]
MRKVAKSTKHMSLMEYIGERIRDLRTSYGGGKGLSQEAIAKELGTAANTISRWETATYRPTIEDLERLARFFGVSILTFFPPEEAPANDQLTALLRAAKQLSPEDLEELSKYAEFRKARSLHKQGDKPKPGRKRKKQDDTE